MNTTAAPARALLRLAVAATALVLFSARGAPAAPFAYVALLGADQVAVIDTATNLVIATVPGGDDPNGVAVSPDGTRAYVTGFLSNTLTVIDTATHRVVATVPVGDGPVGVAASPDGGRLYIANRREDTVSVLDAATLAERRRIAVGNGPNAVAVSPDGRTAYVTNSETSAPGEVSVLDLAGERVRATLAVHRSPNRVAFTPDGAAAYVTNFKSWNATVIDATTDTVITALRIGQRPSSIAVNPNGAWAYVTDLAAGLAVIDLAERRVTRTLPVGRRPSAIAVQRHGGTGYVANFYDHSVTVLDLGDEVAVAEVAVGERPFALAATCVGAGCTEAPHTPKPTRTPTATPTGTPAPPTRTPTAVPIVLRGAHASGAPGDRVRVGIALETNGRAVASLQNDLAFTPGVRIAARPDAHPDCAVSPTIDKADTQFAFLPPGCGGTACSGVRAIVLSFANATPIADGATLYSCAVDIDPGAARGARTLAMSNLLGSTPAGESIPALAVNPIVTVAAAPEIFLRGNQVEGVPGARVTIGVSLDARGRTVSGVENTIVFEPGVFVAERANGRPDCRVNPDIDKNGTAFVFSPSGCGGDDCQAMCALVLALDNVDPIPDGAPLYTCTVRISADAAPGAYRLDLVDLGASTPDGDFIETGATPPLVTVTVARAAAQRIIPAGAALCSGGSADGEACADDADCPDGACVLAQGICAGGADAGLLCDCPGATCVAASSAACDGTAEAGTCAGGGSDGACCDRAFNCARGSACTATHRLCASGASKGSPCLSDADCVAAACTATGRRCAGGTLDGTSCVDAADCPAGTCGAPSPTPTAALVLTPNSGGTPSATATGIPARARDTGGCAVVPSPAGAAALWPLAALVLLRRRPATRSGRGRPFDP